MNKKYDSIWKIAKEYLKKGVRKDFTIHTKSVIDAMNEILKLENNSDINEDVCIVSAILHDIGWSKVPKDIQLAWKNKELKAQGERLHLEYVPDIIREILENLNYDKDFIEKIIKIVLAHKYEKSEDIYEKLLIDADNLSDVLKESFVADAKAYEVSLIQLYNFRKNTSFNTKSAKIVFDRELKKRYNEIKNM